MKAKTLGILGILAVAVLLQVFAGVVSLYWFVGIAALLLVLYALRGKPAHRAGQIASKAIRRIASKP
jgi:hypothetical protein